MEETSCYCGSRDLDPTECVLPVGSLKRLLAHHHDVLRSPASSIDCGFDFNPYFNGLRASPDSDLAKTVASRSTKRGHPKVIFRLSVAVAAAVCNGELDRLKLLSSRGGRFKMSHLCHSRCELYYCWIFANGVEDGPWCAKVDHIVFESGSDNRLRNDCIRKGSCICGLTPKCLLEFMLPREYRKELLTSKTLRIRVVPRPGVNEEEDVVTEEGGETEEEE